jgi:hypothetical protein
MSFTFVILALNARGSQCRTGIQSYHIIMDSRLRGCVTIEKIQLVGLSLSRA